MKYNKGFSYIEVLATFVIVAVIATTAVLSYNLLINKAKENSFQKSVNALEIAVDFYIQNNRSSLPKNNGDTEKVMVSKLKQLGYINNDVNNISNESCMEESYIIISKIDNKYTYTIQMICGNEKKKYKINCEKKMYNLDK